MLILSRLVGEWVVMAGEYPVLVCLTKVAGEGERATLGFCAHEDVSIYRLELLSEIVARNLLAAGISLEERNTLEKMELLLLDPMTNDKAINALLRSAEMVDLLCGDHEGNA